MESFNTKVLNEMKLLSDMFDKLEADVAITKIANSLLLSCPVNTGKQCSTNAQYSRREMLEFVELPKSLANDEVETKVCQIFRSFDCNVNKEDLDACHWPISIKKIWMLVIGLRTRSELL